MEKIKQLRSKIENGYHDRQDIYPPFALTAFEDRARYHEYILKIIDDFIKD